MTLENSVSAGGARCAARRCRKCHGSRKSVRAWYVNAKRVEEWDNMSADETRAITRQNKDKGCGKGIKRQVKVSEKAECSDSAQTGTRQAISDEKTVTCLTTMSCLRLLDQTILCHNMLFISGQRCTYMFCSQLKRFLAELEKRYDWSQED